MMFAEASIGVKGIFGFGKTGLFPGFYTVPSSMKDVVSQETALSGGFGINAKVGAALGSGDTKFLVGFQPCLEFVFGRAEKMSMSSIDATSERSYHTAEIPLLLTLGARAKKVDINFQLGPNVVIPFGFSSKVSLGGAELSGSAADAALAAFIGNTPRDPFIGIGALAGIDVAYNITEHHGITLGYQFKYTYLLGKKYEVQTAYRRSSAATYGHVFDFGSINLGYKYTF